MTLFNQLFGPTKPPGTYRHALPPPASATPARPTVMDLIRHYPGPALLLDAKGTILATSPAFSVRDTDLHDSAWGRDLSGWLSGSHTPQSRHYTTVVATENGSTVIDWSVTALADNTVALLGRDVTLERHLQEALVESRQRFRSMVDMACDFAFEIDGEGRFVYVSGDGAAGHAAAALIGAPCSELLEAERIDRTAFETRRSLRRNPVELKRPDGLTVDALITAQPLFDHTGAWSGARGVVEILETGLGTASAP